jgi:hypothetical protein
LTRFFCPDIAFCSATEAFKEIKRANRFYAECNPGQSWSTGIFNNGFYTKSKKSGFSVFEKNTGTMKIEKHPFHFSEHYFNATIRNRITLF